MKLTSALRIPKRLPVLQVVKMAVAVGLAWVASQLLLPNDLPIFAAIAALLVVQPSVNQTLGRAIERTAGVIGGVIIASTIGFFLGQSSWIVLGAIVVSILVAWALRLSPVASSQIPISAMLVLALGATTPGYALDRIFETFIGAGIALIINALIVPPVLIAPARDAVSLLARELADTFDRIAQALRTPQTPIDLMELMIKARLLRPMQASADKAIAQAEESLMLNPRKARLRVGLDADREMIERLPTLVTRAIGMTRALHDHYDQSLQFEPSVQAFSRELARAAHDLKLLARQEGDLTEVPDLPAIDDLALTAPLRIVTPHPDHWILIGSLMEDLRRVREEIVGDRA
ncbi:FUSC family protein [Cryobacterium sp. PH29-G1]|uniref:FUSC family protein n=1 Tax=Cryobacterium sp. PH29-G1 TaxID=3046211 RepID=UPI0024BAD4CD|nr:FUSC family protein [Cryobacterium sp. PH29-G1]MDJ0350447.1 aromatic acid exporter family protein [Cryobacterium sp. PH29-G1]